MFSLINSIANGLLFFGLKTRDKSEYLVIIRFILPFGRIIGTS